jgi:hypothetical protein
MKRTMPLLTMLFCLFGPAAVTAAAKDTTGTTESSGNESARPAVVAPNGRIAVRASGDESRAPRKEAPRLIPRRVPDSTMSESPRNAKPVGESSDFADTGEQKDTQQ